MKRRPKPVRYPQQDETLYRRVIKAGKVRYEPVRQWIATDGMPEGAHLVVVQPGMRSTYFNVTPAFADLVAASKVALDAMCAAIARASELRQTDKSTTPRERRAFKLYLEALPKNSLCRTLTGRFASPHDIAKAGVDALLEASKTLGNQAHTDSEYYQRRYRASPSKEENNG